jgi:type IV fimbrial biogenesis protein FimT
VRRSRQGFTLIELLVTVVVATVLLLIGVPSFKQIIANNRMAADVNSLVTALNLARSEAIKRGVWVTVCQSNNSTSATPACSDASDWEIGWMVFVDNNNDGVCADADSDGMCDTGSGQILRVWGPLSGGATLRGGDSPTNANVTWVAYQPLGVSQGSTGRANDRFRLCDYRGTSSARLVTIGLGGRVSSSSGTAACP